MIFKSLKYIFFAFCLALAVLPMSGQQVQIEKRVKSPFAFPEFRRAKIIQPFGRYIYADANIFLRGSRLIYREGDKVMTPSNMRVVLYVQFDDTTKYAKVTDDAMARVIAENRLNKLVCVTSIDMPKLLNETSGTDNLPFFEIDGGGLFSSTFLEINGDKWEDSKGFPLTDKYYFIVKGRVVPANETKIRKLILKEKRADFKKLMADRWWSWHDAESLKRILDFLPQ